MSCAYEDDLTAFLDGELFSLRRKQVEQHVAGCASCMATLHLLGRTVEALKALPAFEPSSGMRRHVLTRLDEPSSLWERLRAGWPATFLMPSAGLAAAALVAFALSSVGRERRLETLDEGQVELALNLDVVSDYEVVGLGSEEDLAVVERLKELEARP